MTGVCLLLLMLLAVIHVAHVHSFESDADHCQMCIAMHSVLPLVFMVAAVLLVTIGTAAPILLETPGFTRYWHPALFNRPPPSCS
jgi:hypothetical protein